MKYCLEYAEPYTVATEMLRNRTHQSFRWKQIALSDDLTLLKNMMGSYQRIVRQHPYEVVCKSEVQYR